MPPFLIMSNVLGMDISSSTIGWALLSRGDEPSLLDCGYIKPPKSKSGSIASRISVTYDMIVDLLENKGPDDISVESYANKFTAGRSTARTIIVLSVFNEVVSMACLRATGIETKKYAVSTVRSSLSKMAGRKITSKDETFEFICEYFPNFQTRENRNGNIAKECFDEADAIAVALTYIYKENNDG